MRELKVRQLQPRQILILQVSPRAIRLLRHKLFVLLDNAYKFVWGHKANYDIVGLIGHERSDHKSSKRCFGLQQHELEDFDERNDDAEDIQLTITRRPSSSYVRHGGCFSRKPWTLSTGQ